MVEETKGRLTGRLALVWAGALLLAVLGTDEAHAQQAETETETREARALEAPVAGAQVAPPRRDVFVSGGLGWGSLGFPGDFPREDGISGNLEIATTVEDHDWLRAGFAVSGWTREEADTRVSFGTLTGMARVFPVEGRVFLTGGFGLGKVWSSVAGERSSESGWTGIVGGGYEVELTSRWALSPWANAVGYRINGENADFLQLGLGVTYSN